MEKTPATPTLPAKPELSLARITIKAVFFDAGYTLIQPHPSVTEICHLVCARNGIAIPLSALEAQLPAAERYFQQTIRQVKGIWSNHEKILRFWDGYYHVLLEPFISANGERQAHVEQILHEFAQHTSWALYPEVLHVLKSLKRQGFIIGIISDWDMGLYQILRDLDLVYYFDVITISAAVRLAKPNPGLYDLALRRAKVAAHEALHVGDLYIQDVLGARAAGMTPVLLDRLGRIAHVPALDCPLIPNLMGLYPLLGLTPDLNEMPLLHQEHGGS